MIKEEIHNNWIKFNNSQVIKIDFSEVKKDSYGNRAEININNEKAGYLILFKKFEKNIAYSNKDLKSFENKINLDYNNKNKDNIASDNNINSFFN